ncbi:MAG TPA: dinitrogenase iron-molybdenum cofactor biosynthesis protein, partial [Erysipelotrichaceae bacterium]|nr:dinitrogenase iron-molybdenum cofactor biosynthesis protein [Erysipelotrichaceae bacterium]
MRIAVSYKDGEVFQHFGHSSEFKIYETDHNEIIKSEVITVEGHGHVSVSNALKEQNVNIVLCGGIGQGAKTALAGFGIHSFGGVTGNADEAVKKYLSGQLEFTTDVTCTKHESGE